MKEVNLNASRQAQGPAKMAQAQSQQSGSVDMVVPTDAMEANLTRSPDFTRVEADVETRFTEIKDRLRDDVKADVYPPTETIQQFAKLIASEIEQGK